MGLFDKGGMLLNILKPFMPMVKKELPNVAKSVAEFLPSYLKELEDKHNKQKIQILLEIVNVNGKEYALIRYMAIENGQYIQLTKEDGSPYIEYAETLMLNLFNKGMGSLDKTEDDE